MKKQLEVGGKSHEQTIQDLRHKHNSAIEQLNEQLDNVKKVGNRSVSNPNPIPNPIPNLTLGLIQLWHGKTTAFFFFNDDVKFSHFWML